MNVAELDRLLKLSNYDEKEIAFLTEGFSKGFDLGYRGPTHVKQTSKNLKFVIGNSTELWNKVMKEVKENRYAGPFEEIPFENYIQSPLGLVPKDKGDKNQTDISLITPQR